MLLLGAVAASLALATGAPMATAVVGLILFGVLHNVLEVRYVVGRFSALLTRPFLDLLAALVAGVVACRLLAVVAPGSARLAEIILGYAILAAAAHHGLDGRRRLTALLALGLATVVSLAFPAYHFLVLAHLPNVVPLFFLWDWSRRIGSRRGRRVFRAVQLLWVVVVPAVVLLGGLDAWLGADPGVVRSVVGDGQSLLAANAPPGAAVTVVALRLLTVFAFMQTMGYVVWIAFLPRVAPDASAAFEARVPWATGPRLWAAGFVAAALFAVLLGVDFSRGTTLYAALAGIATYLELPVLLLLLAGGLSGGLAAGTALEHGPEDQDSRSGGDEEGDENGTVIPLPETRGATPQVPSPLALGGPGNAGRHSA
ncbi:hypothetical protein LQK93_02570 [Terrabacter sp. BE26]